MKFYIQDQIVTLRSVGAEPDCAPRIMEICAHAQTKQTPFTLVPFGTLRLDECQLYTILPASSVFQSLEGAVSLNRMYRDTPVRVVPWEIVLFRAATNTAEGEGGWIQEYQKPITQSAWIQDGANKLQKVLLELKHFSPERTQQQASALRATLHFARKLLAVQHTEGLVSLDPVSVIQQFENTLLQASTAVPDLLTQEQRNHLTTGKLSKAIDKYREEFCIILTCDALSLKYQMHQYLTALSRCRRAVHDSIPPILKFLDWLTQP